MRKFNRGRYILVFIIVASIFFLGYFFSFLMDKNRVNYFQSINEIQKLNIRSLQLQNDLISDNAFSNQCSAFKIIFDRAITDLENNRVRIETYTQQSIINKDEYSIIKREYILSQLNFWLISRKFKHDCPNTSDFVTILYFFSDKAKCPKCEEQATVLNYFKSTLKQNILIFSIDESFDQDETMISLLKDIYSIKEYPTLVISDVSYSELNKEQMLNVLCKLYNSSETRDKLGCS